MKDNHLDSQEALAAAEILGVKYMIPPTTTPPLKLPLSSIGEPHSWMLKLANETAVDVCILDVGEIEILS